jgi:hypothetical protein
MFQKLGQMTDRFINLNMKNLQNRTDGLTYNVITNNTSVATTSSSFDIEESANVSSFVPAIDNIEVTTSLCSVSDQSVLVSSFEEPLVGIQESANVSSFDSAIDTSVATTSLCSVSEQSVLVSSFEEPLVGIQESANVSSFVPAIDNSVVTTSLWSFSEQPSLVSSSEEPLVGIQESANVSSIEQSRVELQELENSSDYTDYESNLHNEYLVDKSCFFYLQK